MCLTKKIEHAAKEAALYAKSVAQRKLREELIAAGLDPDNEAILGIARGRLNEFLEQAGDPDPERDLKRACPRGFGRGSLSQRSAPSHTRVWQ